MDERYQEIGANGRPVFKKGNPGGGYSKQIEFKKAFLNATTVQEVLEIRTKLVQMAKHGNLNAIIEFFNRSLGKATDTDLNEQVALLQSQIDLLKEMAKAKKDNKELIALQLLGKEENKED